MHERVKRNKLVFFLCFILTVKVGGMRIVQKHQSEVSEKKDDKDSKEYETER